MSNVLIWFCDVIKLLNLEFEYDWWFLVSCFGYSFDDIRGWVI